MRLLLISAIAVLALPVATLVGCGTKEQPKIGQGRAANRQAAKKVAIDWCIVSGETLGKMGTPVNYTYKDREMKFCCKSCIKEFEADPIVYLARLDSAEAGQITQPRHQ